MTSPSQTLVLWGHAWLRGVVSADALLEALNEWWPGDIAATTTDLLADIRKAYSASPAGGNLRLVLPTAGDIRGLPDEPDLRAIALTEGNAAVIGSPGGAGLGLVPCGVCPGNWVRREITLPHDPGEVIGLGEAEYELRAAMREATAAITEFNSISAGEPIAARDLIADILADYGRHVSPPTVSDRAQRILDTADRVDAILTVAQRFSAPVPASSSAALAREVSLRPLGNRVRQARIAAVTYSVER